MAFGPIYIKESHCLSPAGLDLTALWDSLMIGKSYIADGLGGFPRDVEEVLNSLKLEKALREHDRTVLIGILLARRFSVLSKDAGVIVGSSRGAAQAIEASILGFYKGERLKATTSPTTTASSLSAAIARELSLEGPNFSLSAACSTGIFTVIQGAASLIASLTDEVLVGGIEAANTPFTQEMMSVAKVLSPDRGGYPCRPFAENRKGMILGEGGALLSLTRNPNGAQGAIVGVGVSTEKATLTGISSSGEGLQRSLGKACHQAEIQPEDIDLIVTHGSGTLKGDEAELEAYRSFFDGQVPPLVAHKWCGGHMLGASAALSVILGLKHLHEKKTSPHPYLPEDHPDFGAKNLSRSRHALISSMGFGGSACALIVKV